MIREIVIIVERPAVMIAWITTSAVCVAQILNRNPMITMIIIPIVQGPKYFYIKNKVILIVVGRSYMGIHSNKRESYTRKYVPTTYICVCCSCCL